jgi:hypothetical protein
VVAVLVAVKVPLVVLEHKIHIPHYIMAVVGEVVG